MVIDNVSSFNMFMDETLTYSNYNLNVSVDGEESTIEVFGGPSTTSVRSKVCVDLVPIFVRVFLDFSFLHFSYWLSRCRSY